MNNYAPESTPAEMVGVLKLSPQTRSRIPLAIPIPEIIRVEGVGSNYSRIYLSGGREYRVGIILRVIAERLPTFWRVHKSHLVNPQHVQEIHRTPRYQRYAVLSTGDWLPISRREFQRSRFVVTELGED